MDDSGTHFTQTGQAQIKCITELLQNAGIQAIFSSDLYRTTETAKYISERLRVPLYFSDRLRGMDMGAFHGLPIEEFLRNEDVRTAFIDYDHPIPGGESINQLRERLCGALRDIRDHYSYEKVGRWEEHTSKWRYFLSHSLRFFSLLLGSLLLFS